MKKTFLFILMMGLVMGFTSCNSCKTEKVATENADSVLVVENAVKADRDVMSREYQEDYRWYETCIAMSEYFDADSACENTIVGVSNIFQYVIDRKDGGFDTQVVLFTHVKDTTAVETKHGFWVEDFPMTNEDVKVTFAEAYKKMMEANIVKPHSKQCVLRKEVGPKAANAQYIFGNVRAQVYVDAVTGEVSGKNPVFPDALKAPLGEWP